MTRGSSPARGQGTHQPDRSITSWARRWATTHAGVATTTALAGAADHAGALRFDASGRSAPHGYAVVTRSPSGATVATVRARAAAPGTAGRSSAWNAPGRPR